MSFSAFLCELSHRSRGEGSAHSLAWSPNSADGSNSAAAAAASPATASETAISIAVELSGGASAASSEVRGQSNGSTLVGGESGLRFDLTWDASCAAAPAGFETAIKAAAALYCKMFSNNEILDISVGFGEVGGSALAAGALGESDSTGQYRRYPAVEAALKKDAKWSANQATADASLTKTDPTHGGEFYISNAEAKTLGFLPRFESGSDGAIGLSDSADFNYGAGAPMRPGEYDAVGTAEHELSEVMGRTGSLGALDGTGVYTPLDLFRYSADGLRDLTPGPGYFSIDGGATNLGTYNNPNLGGDAADWTPSLVGDSYGDGYPGRYSVVSPTDLVEDSVLGYRLTAVGLADTKKLHLA